MVANVDLDESLNIESKAKMELLELIMEWAKAGIEFESKVLMDLLIIEAECNTELVEPLVEVDKSFEAIPNMEMFDLTMEAEAIVESELPVDTEFKTTVESPLVESPLVEALELL